MGIQITTQPQVLKTDTVIIGSTNTNNLSAVSGLTVYGSISASNKIFGDGSGLTGVAISSLNNLSGGTIIGTTGVNLSSAPLTATNATFTGSVSSPSVSAGKFYGDGSSLTGLVATGIAGVSLVNSVNSLTGNVTGVFFASGGNLTGPLTGTNSTFTGSVSSPSVSASRFFGDGSGLTGLVATGISGISLVNSVNSLTGNVTGVFFASGGNLTGGLTGTNANFTTSVSSPSINATNYLSGGSNLAALFGSKSSADSVFSTVNSNSADWGVGKTLSGSGNLGYRFVNSQPRIYGDLTVDRIITLSGATFVNTTFTTTSSLCVVNTMNSGAALYVGANGSGDIASFYDIDKAIEILHVAGEDGSSPGVGIRTSFPNKTLTVSGEISASGDAWFGSNIYSNNVNISSLYASKGATDASNTVVQSNSARWNTTWNQISSGSLSSTTGGFTVSVSLSTPSLTSSSATFTTSVSTPSISATNYLSGGQNLTALFGSKSSTDSVFTTVNTTSSNWNQAYTNVQSNSARWNTAWNQISGGSLSATSGGFTVQVSLSTPSLTSTSATIETLNATSILSGGTNLSQIFGTGSVTSLTGLSDVKITNLQDSQVLKYNSLSAAWTNQLDSQGVVEGSMSLNDISDVEISNVQTRNVLIYTASNIWQNQQLQISDVFDLQTSLNNKASTSHTHGISQLSDFSISSPASGQVLFYDTSNSKWNNRTLQISNVQDLQNALNSKQASGNYSLTGHTHTASDITNFSTSVDARILALTGISIPPLVSGKIPSTYIPGSVDDIYEYSTFNTLTSDTSLSANQRNALYVTIDNNKIYRYSGTAYIEIVASPGSTASIPEGGSNLYFTDARAINAISGINGLKSNTPPLMDGSASVGSSVLYARADHVHPTDTTRAPLASPSFTGTPTAPTPSSSDNSNNIATTQFVNNFALGGTGLNNNSGTLSGANLRAANTVIAPTISGVNMYGNLVASVATQTSTFTLALSNAGGILRLNPSGGTLNVNIPLDASVPFIIGTQFIIAQINTGTVNISASDVSITLLSFQSKKTLAAVNSVASLIKTGTNEWLLAGDIN